VPPTCIIEATKNTLPVKTPDTGPLDKLMPTACIGSLQIFVEHDDIACNYSPSLFSVEEVHKIAMLDMHICNMDRNDANILLRKGVDDAFKLIPIDHGMSFPSSFRFNMDDYCWL